MFLANPPKDHVAMVWAFVIFGKAEAPYVGLRLISAVLSSRLLGASYLGQMTGSNLELQHGSLPSFHFYDCSENKNTLESSLIPDDFTDLTLYFSWQQWFSTSNAFPTDLRFVGEGCFLYFAYGSILLRVPRWSPFWVLIGLTLFSSWPETKLANCCYLWREIK